MFLPHDMAHIATRFSVFCITIWYILQHDLAYIAMRLGTDFKRDASDLRKSIYFLPKRYIPFYKKIYAFYSEGISFRPKGTMV